MKTIEEVTMGEIVWAAVRGVLLALAVGAPVIWLMLENADAIRGFVYGLLEHLPDA